MASLRFVVIASAPFLRARLRRDDFAAGKPDGVAVTRADHNPSWEHDVLSYDLDTDAYRR